MRSQQHYQYSRPITSKKHLLLASFGIFCILCALFSSQDKEQLATTTKSKLIIDDVINRENAHHVPGDTTNTADTDNTTDTNAETDTANADSDYAATHALENSSIRSKTDLDTNNSVDLTASVNLDDTSGSAITSTNKNTLSLDTELTQTANLAIPDVSDDYPAVTSSATTNSKYWKTIRVAPGDTMAKIFARLKLPKTTLHEILDSDANSKYLANLHPGQELKFQFDNHKQLLALQVTVSPSKTITINSKTGGYSYHCDEQEIVTKLAYKESTIKDSLFAAAQSVALNDKTILQFADIFSWDIDFAMDIRENDSFRILYEEKYVKNKKIGTGNIVMAEFVNQNQVHRAIRFTDKNGRTGYYTPEGYGMQKAFLRNPVKFTRISSYFSHNRHHPILHRLRAHKGVDYAAPSGTPVEAAGDGKIVFIGTKNGYGQAVELQHGSKYSTFYAHLSRFAKGIRNGSTVRQGDIIGYVGRTGLATGDHLHYEFRVDGVHRDPLTVKLPKSLPIDRRFRRDFQAHSSNMVGLLNKHNREYLAKR